MKLVKQLNYVKLVKASTLPSSPVSLARPLPARHSLGRRVLFLAAQLGGKLALFGGVTQHRCSWQFFGAGFFKEKMKVLLGQ